MNAAGAMTCPSNDLPDEPEERDAVNASTAATATTMTTMTIPSVLVFMVSPSRMDASYDVPNAVQFTLPRQCLRPGGPRV